MTIKTLLGLASGKHKKVNNGSSWTFGWSPSQASALSAKTAQARPNAGAGDRAVGMYGVLATRNGR